MVANELSEYRHPWSLVASVIDPMRAAVIVNYMYWIRPRPMTKRTLDHDVQLNV